MSTSTHQKLCRRKARIARRLRSRKFAAQLKPVFSAANIHYDMSDRARAIAHGGIGAVHLLARHTGLIDAIDRNLHLLKVHLPYSESDHVLNIGYNIICDGDCLQDLERLRNDEAYLDALGASRIPDPTTAGDFCRRFDSPERIIGLMDTINQVRLGVWKQQEPEFLQQAIIDADGTIAPTTGQCKQGMDITYKGQWGYHPAVISLANTKEPLYLINRPGNRPSHEGVAPILDKAIALCHQAGFASILLRGDTDFSQTAHLDRWNDQRGVKFLFGIDASQSRKYKADLLAKHLWHPLVRPKRYQIKTQPRAKPPNVKQALVERRLFENQRLNCEHVADIPYQPSKCKNTYRLIICRKTIDRSMGQKWLWDEYRYFFYITNDWSSTPEELVFSANDRCNQENLIEQLKNGVGALRMPVDNLLSNWAYMVMASLAWTLKAWWGMLLPMGKGPARASHKRQKHEIIHMEFKRFAANCIRLPAQIIRGGRRLIYRFLSYNPYQYPLLRGVAAWRIPAQC